MTTTRALPLMATLILGGRVAEIPAATLRPLAHGAEAVTFPVVYCAVCPAQLVTHWYAAQVDGDGPVILLCAWCAPRWTAGPVVTLAEPAEVEQRQEVAEGGHLAVTDTRAADHAWRAGGVTTCDTPE